MTLFNTLIGSLIFFTTLQAKENTITLNPNKITSVYTLHVDKEDESTYDKFENLFSDYDGTFMEDMFIYTADIFMPDEIIRSTKDIIEHRKDKGFDKSIENFPKTLGNDAFNMFLTTGYYYMQDISQVTERVWSEELCDPDCFRYEASKEPKEPILDLKESDKNARGVSSNGIVLPINENFPYAFYPYAKIPDGCSAEGFKDLYKQSNLISDDNKWLTEACNLHDRCYATIGKTSQQCNSKFIVDILDACNDISNTKTVLSMGSKNAFCGMKALSIATGANSCAEKYFLKAQRQQKIYFQWVKEYEEMYRDANEEVTTLKTDMNK